MMQFRRGAKPGNTSMNAARTMIVPEQVRVLVVDDEPAICRALQIALTRAGYSVVATQSGDAALAIVKSEHIDVLVIDLRIPDTRGDVVFELAAAAQPHLRARTLFMTGDISERAQKLIVSCKCPSIRKPFELRELIDVVGAIAPRRRDVRGQSA